MQSTVSQAILEDFFTTGVLQVFQPGQIVTTLKQTQDYLFYIRSGYVKACNISGSGKTDLLYMGDKGCFFPLIELSSLWQNTELYYQAITQLEVYKVRTRDYYHEKEQSSRFADAVNRHYAAHVHDIAELSRSTKTLSPQKAVAERLKFLSHRFGLPLTKDKVVILAPFIQHDFAASVSLESSVVQEELESMFNNGAVELHGHHLTIHRLALDAIQ